METEEAILKYLIEHGPQTTFRLASVLGIDRGIVVDILNKLAEEKVIEFERGVAKALRKKLPKTRVKLKPRKLKAKKEEKEIKKLQSKPKVKLVKKKLTEKGPRIVRSIIKEVIPEEKLIELETRIKEKAKAFVEEAKRVVTSETEKLIVGLDIPGKLKQLEEKISELEKRPLAKSKIIQKVKIPEELKETIGELTKKLEAILRVKKAREEEVEKTEPKPERKSIFSWFKPSPAKPKIKFKPLPKHEKSRKKVKFKFKLPKLSELKTPKIPKIIIRVPKLKLPKLKIKSGAEKISSKKKGKGVFTKVGKIGKTKFLSEEI